MAFQSGRYCRNRNGESPPIRLVTFLEMASDVFSDQIRIARYTYTVLFYHNIPQVGMT